MPFTLQVISFAMIRFLPALLVGLFLLSQPATVLAQLVSADDPVHGSGSLTLDPDDHTWLDLTLTEGLSYNDVLAQMGPGGTFENYRHATDGEVWDLFVHAGIPTIPGISVGNFTPIQDLQALVGVTHPDLSLGITATPGGAGRVTMYASIDVGAGTGETATSSTSDTSNNFASGNWLIKPTFLIKRDDPVHGPDSLTVNTFTYRAWLDASLSDARSYDDVSSQFGPGGDYEGFRYATESEVFDFLAWADIALVPGVDAASEGPIRALLTLTGTTHTDSVQGKTGTLLASPPNFHRTVYISYGPGVGTVGTGFEDNSTVNFATGSWLVKPAYILSAGDPVHGPDSLTVDTLTGLAWLDASLSDARSYDDVSSHFGPGGDFEGFRYATELEVLEFLEHAAVPSVPGAHADNEAAIKQLLGFTGTTHTDSVQGKTGTLLSPTTHRTVYISFGPGVGTVGQSFESNSTVNGATGSWLIKDFADEVSDVDGDGEPDLTDPCPADPLDACNQSGSAAAEIDASAGGSFETPDGVVGLFVDPNDLAGEGATLSVTEDISAIPEVDLSIASGPGAGEGVAFYEFEPDGLTFDSSITLDLLIEVTHLDPAQRDALDIYLFDEATSTYEPQFANCVIEIDDGPPIEYWAQCFLELDHFSRYAVVVPRDSDGDGVFDDFNGIADVCPEEDASGFDVDDNGCIDSFSGLIDLVSNLVIEGVIDANMENSLLSKVSNAENSYDKDKICAATNQLGAFNNQVAAQTGNKISGEAATLVSDYADSIIAQLLSELPPGDSC